MNQTQIDNLKQLVNDSRILSNQEKTEWTMLLDLMDDKQLKELEKILAIGNMPKPPVAMPAPVAKIKAPEPVLNNKPISQLSKEVAHPQTQIPKLSHILNMPRISPEQQKLKDKANLVAKPLEVKPSVEVKTTLPKKGNSFLQRLKNILSEKELPAPTSSTPLEIKAAVIPVPPKKVEAVKFELKPANKTPEPQPAPQYLTLPPKIVPPALNLKPEVKPPILQPTVKFPEIKKPEPVKVVEEPVVKHSVILNKPRPVGAESGITFAQTSDQDKQKILKEIKLGLEQKKTESLAEELKNEVALDANVGSVDVKMDRVEDLEALSPKALGTANFSILVKKIKNLVAKNGYHFVVFNIEKSPLYKAYIKTGVEILNGKESFEHLTLKNDPGYLSRKNFETCADLLRQIQAG